MSENNNENKKEITSYHTFMFPFTIEDDKFDLKKIKKKLENEKWKDKEKKWEEKYFDISKYQTNSNRSTIPNYNEYVYFYPMVQKLLYHVKGKESSKEKAISKYFEFKNRYDEYQIYMKVEEKKIADYSILLEDDKIIFLHKKEKNKIKAKDIYLVKGDYYICEKENLRTLDENFTLNSIVPKCKYKKVLNNLKNCENFYIKRDDYRLNITGIALRIFNTGIGILSFHLENYVYNSKSDILKINDFGRRIYPQFKPINNAKSNFLADKLVLKHSSNNKNENISESFSDNNKIYISNTIMKLLGEEFSFKKSDKKKFLIKPLIDDRMFTLCWYGDDDFSRVIREYHSENKEYNYMSNDNWAKFLFVDGSYNSLQSNIMLKEHLKAQTYDRWINDETLFGVSRYSFVCLTNEEWFPKNIILTHMKTMYYQIMVIALMQRASILKFKHKISKLVGKKDSLKIRNLQEEYLEFLNSMNFREVTAQEQGIEIYNMVRDIMGINESVRELEQEIQELHNYHAMLKSENVSKNSENLALIAGVIVVPTLIVTLLGIINYNDKLSETGIKFLDNNDLISNNIKIFYGIVFPASATFIILKFKSWFRMLFKQRSGLGHKILNLITDEILILVIVLILYLIWIA